jgi:hypothetical protein
MAAEWPVRNACVSGLPSMLSGPHERRRMHLSANGRSDSTFGRFARTVCLGKMQTIPLSHCKVARNLQRNANEDAGRRASKTRVAISLRISRCPR